MPCHVQCLIYHCSLIGHCSYLIENQYKNLKKKKNNIKPHFFTYITFNMVQGSLKKATKTQKKGGREKKGITKKGCKCKKKKDTIDLLYS